MEYFVGDGIKKYYGRGDHLVKAVDGISLEIENGKFTAIIGTSGSGKSTLLHCMAGLDKPTEGSVFLNERDIYALNDDELSKIRRQEFGFIFQSFNLIPVLNVYDNIILPIQLDGKKEDKEYIMSIVKKVGLEDQLKKFPNELSGGQQQRVAIARALSTKPAVLLCDEPTGNLDSVTGMEVVGLLKSSAYEFHQTIVVVTHNEEIAQMADRIIRIEDGKVKGDTYEE